VPNQIGVIEQSADSFENFNYTESQVTKAILASVNPKEAYTTYGHFKEEEHR
jgi:hypothetical protein